MQLPIIRGTGQILYGFLLWATYLSSASIAAAEAPRESDIRNVVFIMGDDHAAYALGCYGSHVAQTQNLDRLAENGVRFERAYVNSPVCSASRQSILTSQLPHAVGVNLLFTPLSVETVTIADHLKARGFQTAAIGKMHFTSYKPLLRQWGYLDKYVEEADDHHGFDLRIDRYHHQRYLQEHPPRQPPPGLPTRPDKKSFEDLASHWNSNTLPGPHYEADSEGRYFAREAADFVRKHQNDRFCLWLSFREPHCPFNFPIEYAGRFKPDAMPLPAASPEDKRWIPAVFRDVTDAEARGISAAYYTSVAHLDANIGFFLNALEAANVTDRTLVVYVGDHGYLLGHHGRFEKHTMWEQAVRAPLIISNPNRLGRGRVMDELVEFIDLVPTIVELLGVDPMATAEGQSLVPLLDGAADRHRDYVFSEFLVDDKAMVRTERFKYIFTAGRHDLAMGFATGGGAPGVVHRLYDLQEDPGETCNLADNPKYTRILRELQQLMLQRFMDTHPEAGTCPGNLSIDRALSWFTRPRDPLPDGVPVK